MLKNNCLALVDGPLGVDARRWRQRGIVRQTLRNWSLMCGWRCGASLEWLAGHYRRHDHRWFAMIGDDRVGVGFRPCQALLGRAVTTTQETGWPASRRSIPVVMSAATRLAVANAFSRYFRVWQ